VRRHRIGHPPRLLPPGGATSFRGLNTAYTVALVVSLQERSATERVQEARERYVARGISTPPLVVERAEGARIWDAEGREYIDFAGGLGCANLGHNLPAVVDALHAQVDRYLHQCFMVGMYEPYVEVCRRLAELSLCRGANQKSLLLNSGAEAVENAVKIARVATGRPAVIVFDNAFHGRTLLSMTMTSKVVPYKKGFGPFAPEIYRTPAPYVFRGVSEDDAIAALKHLFKGDVDPESVACAVLEPVQGEGGFIPMTPDFPKRLQEILDSHGILYVNDEVQSGCGRTGPVWAIEHYGIEPDLTVSGKTLGGGLPLAAVTGRAEIIDTVPPGGLGGTFGGNPLSCAAAIAILDALADARPRAEQIGTRLRARLTAMAPAGSDVRGLGPMLAIELPEQMGDETSRITAAAREQGLMLLSCGIYGNVIRILVPFAIGDAELEQGLDILERCLGG
jgi:4-aminobutyrate aminotransferase / (S)-3-amino-2-methylpropionate transaminase / 5-aminovalerate transaminase